jgi:hypothetical protein
MTKINFDINFDNLKFINNTTNDEIYSIVDFNSLGYTYIDKDTNECNKLFFLEKPSIEHYRFLAYLSTKFISINILDIGTALGLSALALSYNPTNTIHTFDINNTSLTGIKKRENIHFIYDNLFETSQQLKYNDLILNSPLIFLDVEPHNGIMEYSFYNYLKSINYKGIMICDDIHYYKDMKNNFWNKIPDEEKIDITHLGHWSGTGMILFK